MSIALNVIAFPEPIVAKKAPVDPETLTYKTLLDGPFWQKLPTYRDVSEAQFLDHNWQSKNSMTSWTLSR